MPYRSPRELAIAEAQSPSVPHFLLFPFVTLPRSPPTMHLHFTGQRKAVDGKEVRT